MNKRTLLHFSLILLLALPLGCKSKPNDTQIQEDIQSKVAANPETQDSAVNVVSQQGKVTVTGKVKKPAASKAIDQIAKAEPGVTSVDDETTVAPATVAEATPAPAAAVPAAPAQPAAPPPPPPPPPPIVVPANTTLTVSLGQAVGSKISQTGTAFTATMANPIVIGGKTAIPEGSQAAGVVTDAKPSGKFKGGAVLNLQLTSIVVRGQKYNIQTTAVNRTSTGKGKRTTGMVVGGTGAGAAIGGLAGGGKGAAIGALAGAGAGTVGAMTGNRDITLPAESVVSFQLTQPLTLKPRSE